MLVSASAIVCTFHPRAASAQECGDGCCEYDETLDSSEFHCPRDCSAGDDDERLPEMASCGDGCWSESEHCDESAGSENCDQCLSLVCGNGVVQGAEECDDGSNNSDSQPDACRTDCRLSYCRDGVIDSDEECDDGSNNSDLIPDRCRTDCTNAGCGDGLIDFMSGDYCDDGNTTDGDGCSSDCVVETGFSCYGQPSFCSSCGDGNLDGFEECDQGAANSDTEPNACRRFCTLPRCGDGVADDEYGESCDDGVDNSRWTPDACRQDCSLPTCGDDVHDPTYGEECDLGSENSDAAGTLCTTTCQLPACGDGILNADEMCEPSLDPDCNDQCRPNYCGDGIVSTETDEAGAPLEVCDDGNNADGDDCRYDCGQDLTLCGNGTVDDGEACDDGDANGDQPGATCLTDCQLPRCGDGVTNGDEGLRRRHRMRRGLHVGATIG